MQLVQDGCDVIRLSGMACATNADYLLLEVTILAGEFSLLSHCLYRLLYVCVIACCGNYTQLT